MLDFLGRASILVEFRSGAVPPLVVISTDHDQGLLVLKQAMLRLATDEGPASISVSQLGGVTLQDLDELVLVAVADAERLRPVIEASYLGAATIVTFYERPTDWITRAELVGGIIESGQPGFQWLTGHESLDPIDVVVSFRSDGQY
jgi:hypothetical protein